MKIVYIASYGPRKCGIATFTGNKFTGMNCKKGRNSNEGIVVAVNDPNNEYEYPEEVKFVIHQEKPADYLAAANFINESGADVCIMEHEFGIYGGRDGVFILSLLRRLRVPVISVLHTVLKTPSPEQKEITREITDLTSRTVVMTAKAVDFLTQIYGIQKDKLAVIDHGIPDCHFSQATVKREFNLTGKKVLLTFGLISRNKGIETVLKALPPVIDKHPDTVYLILGKTHPSVVQHSGEEYRDYLKGLAKENGIEDHVVFVDEFTDERKLCKYLSAADIYITPYLNEAQITSGTLSYAVGAGCAVVSTPYWHATELLTEDKGRLFPFNDFKALTEILEELMGNKALLSSLRRNARAYGREVVWPRIGERYLSLARLIISEDAAKVTGTEAIPQQLQMPAFSLDHVRRMTDSTGIFQHARYSIPNYQEGYCLDDNARALLLTSMCCRMQKNIYAAELIPTYLAYIQYMQNEDGSFRNFMSFSRQFLDEVGSEDAFGRTIWALGYAIANPVNRTQGLSAREIFMKAFPQFEKLTHLRSIANTILGICHYLQTEPQDGGMIKMLQQLSDRLMAAYKKSSHQGWEWFQSELTYDNAILPLSLYSAGSILEDKQMLEVAKESRGFLAKVNLEKGFLSVVGNEKWYGKNGERSMFAQQPIDAMMMVLLFAKAWSVEKDDELLQDMQTCFRWFLGENDLLMKVYDPETKGCFDGLESYGVNQNQGAESTLAYLISHVAVREALAAAVRSEQSEKMAAVMAPQRVMAG